MRYLIGLDNGGTYTKAVVFDTNGNICAQARRQIQVQHPHEGWVERDMEELWLANCGALREAVEKAAIDPALVAGISFSGHGKGLYLWGKDGKAAYAGILSSDARASQYPALWNSDGTAGQAYAKTAQRVLACQPVSLLRWFSDYQPDVLEHTQWVFGVKDYIRFRLTGYAAAELTDFSGSNLVDLHTRQYDDELLELFGIGGVKSKLPALKSSCDLCGVVTQEAAALTGLCAGTPAAAGMFDIDACAIAMDITQPDYLCVIAGTWGIHEYVSPHPVTSDPFLLNSVYCIPELYLVEDSSPTSASNNEWFTNTFLHTERLLAAQKGENIYQSVDCMVESVMNEEQDVFFFPYLYGSNYNPKAKASFVGISASTTLPLLARAVFEGIAMCHRVHIERLLSTRASPRCVRLSGGVTNSDIWVQIFADIFNLPIEIVCCAEPGALGAATAASVAVGIDKNLQAAAKRLVQIKYLVLPDAGRAIYYRERFARYQQIAQALDTLYQ